MARTTFEPALQQAHGGLGYSGRMNAVLEAPTAPGLSNDTVIDATQRWVERAVIGLNLCPFAKAVFSGGQLRIEASAARSAEDLLGDLAVELTYLAQVDPELIETTLLVAPHALPDFLDFNDFLGAAEEAIAALDLKGTLQVVGFHPRFRFDGAAEDDMGNFSNRSPYPTLHLLREASITRAVAAIPDPRAIYGQNIRRLRALGLQGWLRLMGD